MRVVVFGASGGTGRKVVDLCLAEGWEVVALVRDGRALPMRERLTLIEGSPLVRADVARAMKGSVDFVFSTLGNRNQRGSDVCERAITHILDEMALRPPPHRLIVVSSLGVAKEFLSLPARIIIGTLLKPAHDDLRRMEARIEWSDVDWTIVRPPRLTDGCGHGAYQILTCPERSTVKEIARVDVAHVLIRAAKDGTYVRERPAIGYTDP